jgi:hypothetical protein
MTTEFDDDQVIDHEDLINNHNRIRKRRKWFDNYPANLRKWSGERKWRPSQFASEQEGRKEGAVNAAWARGRLSFFDKLKDIRVYYRVRVEPVCFLFVRLVSGGMF